MALTLASTLKWIEEQALIRRIYQSFPKLLWYLLNYQTLSLCLAILNKVWNKYCIRYTSEAFDFNWKRNNTGLNWKSRIKEFVQFVLVRCLSCTEGYDGIIYKQEFYDIKSACIAIKIELEDRDFIVKQQFPIQVTYKKNVVGDYYADLYLVD